MNIKNFISSLDNIEIETSISREDLLDILSEACTEVLKNENSISNNNEVIIDLNGNVNLYIVKKIVEDPSNEEEISFEEANKIDNDANIGDEILINSKSEAPLNRINVKNIKNLILSKINQFKRKKLIELIGGDLNKIVKGVIEKKDNIGNVYLSIKGIEAVLPIKEQSPLDDYKIGKKISVVMLDISVAASVNFSMAVSRSHTKLVRYLFEQEVPEISSGIVEIKEITRIAGFKTKIAVISKDKNVNAVGVCIGKEGNRISKITEELNRERIDVFEWNEDFEELIKNFMKPIKIEKIENLKNIFIYVKKEEMPIAIGKNWINIRLLSKITKKNIMVKEAIQE